VLQENGHATAASLKSESHLGQETHIPYRITALKHVKNARALEKCKKVLTGGT